MKIRNTTNRIKRIIGRTLLYGSSIIFWIYLMHLDQTNRPQRQELWDGASYLPAGEYTMFFIGYTLIGAMIVPIIGISLFDKGFGLKFFRSKWTYKN